MYGARGSVEGSGNVLEIVPFLPWTAQSWQT